MARTNRTNRTIRTLKHRHCFYSRSPFWFLFALAFLVSCAPPGTSAGSDSPTIVALMEKASETLTDAAMVADKINDYMEPLIGAKIDIRYIDSKNYYSVLDAIFAANEQADILFSVSFAQGLRLANEGKIIPLDALVAEYGEGIASSIIPGEADAGRINGQLYGLTTNRNKGYVFGFQYRKDIAEKYGVDLSGVRRLGDLTPIFAQLKEANAGMRPYIPTEFGRSYDTLGLDFFPFGVLLDYGQGDEVANFYETQAFEDQVRLLREWNQAGYVVDTSMDHSSDWHYYMRSDNVFCRFDTDSPEMAERESRALGKPVGYVALSPVFTSSIDMTYAQWSITASCKRPDKAMAVLNRMYADPVVANLLLNGIEGRHYEFVDKANGVIGFPPGEDSSTSGYAQFNGWKWCNQFITYIWDGNPNDLWRQIKDYNDDSLKSKALGFIFDAAPVQNEYRACAAVQAKYSVGFEMGALDPDVYLPQFRQEMNEAGIERIIAEKRKQLDGWRAEKGAGG